MATATAWFSATTGLSEIRIRTSYSAMICGQSVASADGASSWTAAIAACSWYGPAGAAAERPGDEGRALGDQAGVPAAPVLFGQGDQLAVQARSAPAAARR